MLRFLRSKSEDATDAILLERFKTKGDINALAVLFDRYLELIYGLCLQYFSDPAKAEDAVMDIYIALQEKVPQHDIHNFKSWLFTFTRNHCLMVFRKEKKRIDQSFDSVFMHFGEELHPIMEEVIQDQKPDLLEECIEKLSAEQKSCIEMFYFKEMTYKKIAELTSHKLGTVRSYIQNGRRNLKICIEKKEEIL